MNTAEAVGRTLAGLGVRQVFGVVGSGNFHVTNALIDAGARFVAARHESGAATMADAFARMSDTVTAVSVHQGCGLTNTMTGITEAAKSRTPLLVLAAEATSPLSNFHVDQPALAAAVGAVSMRVTSPASAVNEAATAYWTARHDRRTVLLNLPLDVQAAEVPADAMACPEPTAAPDLPVDEAGVARLVEALAAAKRPVFVAGRGARTRRNVLERLADAAGALLATSAVANGLFEGSPWSLGISGGFASPLAVELIRDADLIVGWGCALNMWTMSHGALIGPGATIVQVDLEPEALGRSRPITFGVVGDVEATASAAATSLPSAPAIGYRSARSATRISRDGSVARRADRGHVDGGADRPARPQHRARRPVTWRARRGDRFRELHGLPERVPGGT